MADDVRCCAVVMCCLSSSHSSHIHLFSQKSDGDFSDGLDEFEESADETNFKKKVSSS